MILGKQLTALVRRALADAGAYRNAFPADRWERTFPTLWEAEKDERRVRAIFALDATHGVEEIANL